MPISTSAHLTYCVQRIHSIQPGSVLDVGCGFGVWGFLCREYLDVWNGRVAPSEWQTRIDGIEVFAPYIQAHQKALYDRILIQDVRDAVKVIGEYDLIIAGDVIEHLEKAEGEAVLEALYEKARKALLVNIPLGEGWNHPEAYGNPGELHRSQWSAEDFGQFAPDVMTFELSCGQYGVFWCAKDASAASRAEGFVVAAEARTRRGEHAAALNFLRQAHAIEPSSEGALAALVNALLTAGETGEAVDYLRAAACLPGAYAIRLLLARVLSATSRHAEAHEELVGLLADPSAPEEVAAAARKHLDDIRRRFA